MTNNDTNTIALTSATHGTFRVRTSHLDEVIDRIGLASITWLRAQVHAEVGIETDIAGQGSYSDLTRSEALVVLSYLTGGAAD